MNKAEPIRVLIADDETLARRGIRHQLERHPRYQVVAEAADGAQTIQRIKDSSPDVVFLDVSMPLGDGFDVVSAVGKNNMPSFIFVTAYQDHALRAFDVNAVDYLLTPIDPERFDEALQRSEARRGTTDSAEVAQRLERVLNALEHRLSGPAEASQAQRISIKTSGKVLLVDANQIDRLESEGNYLNVWIKGTKHQVRETMQEFLARAGTPAFTRVHRSIAVNRSAVKGIEPFGRGTYVLMLRDGSRVLSSYSYRENVLSIAATA